MTVAVTDLELAPGVELLGPYRDSGLENPPYLMRRAGRILQVSRLLYTVAEAAAEGGRTFDEMAAAAAAELGRPLSGEHIRVLVQNKLVPAGILAVPEEHSSAATEVAPPAGDERLLRLRFRRAVLTPEAFNRAAGVFRPLFYPVVVAGTLAGIAALDVWFFAVHGVSPALGQVVRSPALTVLALALVGLSNIFHEFGHAAGCRYSGGRPGAAGVGLYLWWPVMYTNVTDAYRLDRRGRLRTDLGGIYFNAIFTLALGGAYAATGWEPLLAIVVLEHISVVHQLVPFVRLDGYYIVSDLAGVPDILSRVRPALRSLIPGRPTDPAVLALRPRARRILFAYLASIAVFLAVAVVPGIRLLPKTLAAHRDAIGPHVHALGAAMGQWDAPMALVWVVAVAVLALPLIGLVLTVGLVATRLVQEVVSRWAPGRQQPLFDPSELAIVEGTEMPDGGAVDYFGFGPAGELVLFGTAPRRRLRQEVAARLLGAARTLHGRSTHELDRLLLEGPPFAEVVAGRARHTGRPWDEQEFRARLDDTLARGAFQLVVLEPGRFGTTLSVYPLAVCANRHKTEKTERIGTSARKSYNKDCVRAAT